MRNLIALLGSCLYLSAQPMYTVTLVWDYVVDPPDSVTNYTFIVHGSTNAASAVPWQVSAIVPGVTSKTLPILLEPGNSQFWYVTATRPSTDTDLYFESEASNQAAAHRMKPVRTTITGSPMFNQKAPMGKAPAGKARPKLASPKCS